MPHFLQLVIQCFKDQCYLEFQDIDKTTKWPDIDLTWYRLYLPRLGSAELGGAPSETFFQVTFAPVKYLEHKTCKNSNCSE